MHFFWQKHFLVSIAVFFVSIAVNCTRFSESSTMPFIRGNARHAGRPPKCKVQISADNRGIKTKRILFLRGRRCNFWKVKAPFPAKLPMRCDSLRTVKAVQAPPHTVPLRRLQNRRQIPLKRQNIALTSPPPTHRHTQTHTDTHRHTDTQISCLFTILLSEIIN